MTTTMTITLLIVAVSSLMLNVYQWAERKADRKETDKLVADAAQLEYKYNDLLKTYQNEKLHRQWAIGRINDQQAVIDQLKSNKVAYKPRKEGNGHA